MNNSLKSKMFSGALWSSAGKFLSMGANFVLTLILARALAPSDYAAYFVALSTIVIIAGVGTLGMDRVVVRFAAQNVLYRNRSGLRQVIGRCTAIVASATLLTCIVFYFVASYIFKTTLNMPSLAAFIWVITAWLFFATLQRQLAETFRGLHDIRLATLFGGVRSVGLLNGVLTCAVVLVLWLFGSLTLYLALLAGLGVSVFVVLVSGIVLWANVSPRRDGGAGNCPGKISKFGVKLALYEGWPLWLALLIYALNNTGGAWLAGALDSPENVALFGIALRFAILVTVPVAIINAVLPPVASQLHAAGQLKRLERIVRSFSGLLLVASLVVLVILIALGRPLLNLFFGPYYEASYLLLLILCSGQIVNIATGSWRIVLSMTGGRRQMLVSSLIGAGVQVVAGIILGLQFGVLGVAIGLTLSRVVANIVGTWFVHRKLGIWTVASLDMKTLLETIKLIIYGFRRKFSWQN